MIKIISLAAVLFVISGALALSYEPVQSSQNASKASYDIQFLDSMIAHHKQGVEMAEMAMTKSQNARIRTKAETTADKQQSEIAKMQVIRNEVQEDAPLAINMNLDGMKSLNLKSLELKSARNFDDQFLTMSIEHDEAGLVMSKSAARRATNLKVQDIARNLSDSQSGELSELREIMKSRY